MGRGILSGEASLLLLTGALYALSATRGALGGPVWIADGLLLIAAYLATQILHSPYPLFAVAWTWAIARMTAALNRMPQVTGGYLGIVALTLLLLLHFNAHNTGAFPFIASAALAGAGLATMPRALRHPAFNLGWSAALAMGYLLAQIAALGVLRNTAFAILALSLLVFGLPLLDISFYRLRAARRGQDVEWEEKTLRLHEALLLRGLSSMKIALLYLAISVWLCGIGVLVGRFLLRAELSFWGYLLWGAVIGVLFLLGFIIFFSLTRVLMNRHAGEEIPDEVEAFGVRISPVSMEEALDKIDGFIQSQKPHQVASSDANAILRAREDPEYAEIIRRADLMIPDGYGVIWGARLLNLPVYERVTGVDVVTGICERAVGRGYTIYILGSAPGIASTAAQKLMERYPGLQIIGTQHGYYKPDEEGDIVHRIRDARPDVLFVAFGIPRQEKFIGKYLHELNVPVCMGVGGSFDVYSEKLKRAPAYIQRSGLEWLYRVWIEPSRWKRMAYVPRFIWLALREWLFASSPGQGRKPSDSAS